MARPIRRHAFWPNQQIRTQITKTDSTSRMQPKTAIRIGPVMAHNLQHIIDIDIEKGTLHDHF